MPLEIQLNNLKDSLSTKILWTDLPCGNDPQTNVKYVKSFLKGELSEHIEGRDF